MVQSPGSSCHFEQACQCHWNSKEPFINTSRPNLWLNELSERKLVSASKYDCLSALSRISTKGARPNISDSSVSYGWNKSANTTR
jgi:hypothetical protein